jgi:hypothetical protein
LNNAEVVFYNPKTVASAIFWLQGIAWDSIDKS